MNREALQTIREGEQFEADYLIGELVQSGLTVREAVRIANLDLVTDSRLGELAMVRLDCGLYVPAFPRLES